MSPSTTSKLTTDHEEIRRWAEERGAKPAAVAHSENNDDPGIIRLEFPGASNRKDDALEEISWDEWFEKFDERGLAFLYQEHTAIGEKSNFNKIISRETAEEAESALGGKGRSATHKAAGQRAAASAGSRGNVSGRQTERSAGSEETTKRSTSARGRSTSSGRASTRSRSGEKRSSSASRGGASRGSESRNSRTTSRATGLHSSARSSGTPSVKSSKRSTRAKAAAKAVRDEGRG